MANQNYFSVLNTVAATHADYGTVTGGTIKITGLPAYAKKDLSTFTKVASSGFTSVDTNASINGTTITWSANKNTTTGEVLEVTKNGFTYYAAILTGTNGTPAATQAVLWLGPNGTPATASGYAVTRKGAAFTNVVFANLSATSTVALGIAFNAVAEVTDPTIKLKFSYDGTSSTTATNLQDSFYTFCNTYLNGLGLYVAKSSTTTVVIYQEPNTYLNITSVTGSGYTAATVTATAPTPRLGYGADLIAQYGYPAASSSTANDGIVSTNFYTVYTLNIEATSAAGANNNQNYGLLIATDATNASTLISYLDSNLL